jgi:hypothetical protein
MADKNTSNRGLANADQETRERVARAGAEAQPKEAKAKGGRNSRNGGNKNS